MLPILLSTYLLDNMNLFGFKNNLNKGFTLIELLVVISIVGLLSSILLAGLNGARSKARDARRLSDMRQVQLALELYRDANGFYPAASINNPRENSCGSGNDTNTQMGKWDSALSALVTQKFLPNLPIDPVGSVYNSASPQFCYTYITPTSASVWASCTNTNGASYLDANLYSYILYYSTEATPGVNEMRPYWNGVVPAPQNRCILGPLK